MPSAGINSDFRPSELASRVLACAHETSETRVGQPRCPMLLLRCGPLIESEGTSMPCIRISVAFATLVIAITPARAQEWPTRPITMVVPFAAGGPLDVVGRLWASRSESDPGSAGGGGERYRGGWNDRLQPRGEGGARWLSVCIRPHRHA